MTTIDASAAGTFRIGGDLTINRLGFGALHLTGPGNWGPPQDREGALELLRVLPALGVNFIDTADSYGPDSSEQIIRDALRPYEGMVVATKAGLVRDRPDQWRPDGHPDRLIAQARRSLVNLGVERIDLWQLHPIDRRYPAEIQFQAVRYLMDEGIIRHAGLSQVSIADIRQAQAYFPVATVQNLYNLANRDSEEILDYCEASGVGFIPWHPLASGGLAHPGSPLAAMAQRKGVTPSQIALAWMLRRSQVMIPIPGTSCLKHLRENIAATSVELSDIEYNILTQIRP